MTGDNTVTHADDVDHIRLSERQRARFDRIKAECANDHLPEPTDELMVKSLMDTWDAVDGGLYAAPEPSSRDTDDDSGPNQST
jgi:hypothetical protein